MERRVGHEGAARVGVESRAMRGMRRCIMLVMGEDDVEVRREGWF